MKKILKNLLIVVLTIVSMIYLISCKNVKLNDFDKKIVNAYKVGLRKQNHKNIYIEKLANIVEDKEDFVFLKIDGIWYILAINDYNYMDSSDENKAMFKIKGWRIMQKAKFGEFAEAVAIFSDLAEINFQRYNYDLTKINEALHLKFVPNV